MLPLQGSDFSHELLITQLHLAPANCWLTERSLKSLQKHPSLLSQAQTSAVLCSTKLVISVALASRAVSHQNTSPRTCEIITAQLIYKLQIFKQQEYWMKNEKYCFILVQICVPSFSLSCFYRGTLQLWFRLCFCFEEPSASCCGLPSCPQPRAVCHPIKNMAIGIRLWSLAPKMTLLPFTILWNCPLKGEKDKLGWVLCHRVPVWLKMS